MTASPTPAVNPGAPDFSHKLLINILVSRAGLEPIRLIENRQVADSTKRQKRQNRSFRRIEVHGGYTEDEFYSGGATR